MSKPALLPPLLGRAGERPGRPERLLLALSGGPDSVALLRMMLDKGYNVEAAHCNFHLRGAESDRDEAFCKDLCEKLGVKLHIVHFDTKEFAELRGISIEMAARELRYRWFTQLAHDTAAESVCIAHHSDDQVETILLNMLRGTGLKDFWACNGGTVSLSGHC
jgi:tRNA(Ile)-lysidine synthase